jgi:enolase 1/2/3
VSQVRSASARRIFDSRGAETIEVRLESSEGVVGTVGAPSGASTGAHEVRALPNGGVAEALATFAVRVAPALVGRSTDDLAGWDATLHAADGTDDFSRIGGNTATAASLALARLQAATTGQELWSVLRRPGVDGTRFPAIVGNCLNGGRHAVGGPEIQEFHAYSPAPRPSDSVRAALAVHQRIGAMLQKKLPGYALGRGDEGGWVAPLGNIDALEILVEACAQISSELKVPVYPGLDLAASEFYRDGEYRYRERSLDAAGQVAFLSELVDKYGLRYLEDPFQEEDFDSFAALTAAVGRKTLVVGDDLYTTSSERFEVGLGRGSSNAILIKVNQVGTLTDTFRTVDLARSRGLETVTSHRSGDLPDGWLAHVALATGAAGLKCGLLGGERVAKLNELLRLGAATGA